MSIGGKIKEWKRSVILEMTKDTGVSPPDGRGNFPNIEIKRVLICRPNHRLGNQLLITPLLQDIIETFPQAKIDLLVKGKLGPVLFKNYDHVNKIIQLPAKPFSNLFQYLNGWIIIRRNRYDLAINVVYHSSSGRLAAKFANAKYKCFGDVTEDIQLKHKDHEHSAKGPVYSFRNYISILGLIPSEKQVAPLNLKLSPSELVEGKKILSNLVNNDKKTICIFTYATGAKCYSQTWWEEFYGRLTEYQDYNIVEVLPAENVSQISFKAPSFYSRDIRQIGSFIANTAVFIGADSGMMHLASSSQTLTVGLFNVKNPDTFGPYGNNSVAIDTNTNSIAECVKIIDGILMKRVRILS